MPRRKPSTALAVRPAAALARRPVALMPAEDAEDSGPGDYHIVKTTMAEHLPPPTEGTPDPRDLRAVQQLKTLLRGELAREAPNFAMMRLYSDALKGAVARAGVLSVSQVDLGNDKYKKAAYGEDMIDVAPGFGAVRVPRAESVQDQILGTLHAVSQRLEKLEDKKPKKSRAKKAKVA